MMGHKKQLFAVLLATTGMAAFGAGAQAQAQTSNAPAAAAEPTAEDIVVVGMRASLNSARAIKRNADTIVDSVVAEDIGKLPDQNIAESLGRIPGVQITRREGEGAGITIRGLGNVKTVLNGRELFGGNGRGGYSSRDFSLQDMPSEVLAGIDVYKSSNADQIEGGLGGYVNIRTRRPFDFNGFTASVTAKAIYYDRLKGFQDKALPTVSGLISNRWETGIGDIGALFNISYGKSVFSADRSVIGPPTSATPTANFGGSGQAVTAPAYTWIGVSQHGKRERLTMVGALEWKPSDSLSLYAEGYYVKFERLLDFEDYRIGFGTPTSSFSVFPGTNDLSSATFLNSKADSATAYADEFRTTKQYAVGGKWDNGGRLKVSADLSYTSTDNKATLDEYDMATTLPSVDFSVDKSGNHSVAVSGIDMANPANYKPAYLLSILLGGKQHATTGTLGASYDFGDGILKSIDVGARYSDYVAVNQGFVSFYCANTTFAGNAPCGGGTQTTADIPASFYQIYPSVAGDFVGWNVAAMRQSTTMRQFFGLPTSEPLQNGVYLRSREKTTAIYGKINYDIPLGGMSFDGNIGGRFIRTNFGSDAYGTDALGAAELQHKASTRNDFLPTFNGRLKISDSTSLRLAAGKSLERIAFGDLSAATFITNQAQLEARSGNPDLQPFTSTNFDVSLESYFSDTGLVYAAGFYKKVKGYLQTVTVPEPINGVTYKVTKRINGQDGTIKGFELGVQSFLDFLPSPLDGFGIQANYTFVKSAVPSPVEGAAPVEIEGLSPHAYNLIAMYEKGPISGRLAYSWRDKVVTNSAPFGAVGMPNMAKGFGTLDFSVSYDINDHLSVSVDGVNIAGATTTGYFLDRTTLPEGPLFLDRRFGVQVRYKF